MRKRILVYVTAAILIGIAMMALPLALQDSLSLTPMDQGKLYPASPARSNAFSGQTTSPISGLVRQPVNVVPLSGIMLSGLLVALSIYIIMKKRTG